MSNFIVWVLWLVAAFSCLASGIAVVTFGNPFYSALALIVIVVVAIALTLVAGVIYRRRDAI